MPPQLLQDQEARDYLDWRVRMAFAQRAQHFDHALEFQAERDRVLAEAIRFLRSTDSQVELFAAAEAEALAKKRAQAVGTPSGD